MRPTQNWFLIVFFILVLKYGLLKLRLLLLLSHPNLHLLYDLIVDEPQLNYQGSTYINYGNPYIVNFHIPS
jgi:hypothetical protein